MGRGPDIVRFGVSAADATIVINSGAATKTTVDQTAMTMDSQRPANLAVAVIFAALVPVHPLLMPGRPGLIMSGAALATSAILFMLWGALHTRLEAPITRHTQQVGTAVALLVAANTLLHVEVTHNPWPTCAVMILIVGCGAALSSHAGVAVVMITTDLVWVALAVHIGNDPLWGGYAAEMGAANILGAALHVIRHRTVARLETAQRVIAAAALSDDLTGLKNRRGLLLAGDPLLEISRRMGQPLAVLYLDVDGLKQVNDTQGHAAGDRLIADTGEILETVFRSADVVARLGGDEFAVLLAGAAEHETSVFLERLRRELADKGISASVGVVHSDPAEADQSLEQLVDMADLAMYAVKRAQRAAAVT